MIYMRKEKASDDLVVQTECVEATGDRDNSSTYSTGAPNDTLCNNARFLDVDGSCFTRPTIKNYNKKGRDGWLHVRITLNLHLQHLILFRAKMRSNADLSAVSYTISAPQSIQLDAIMHGVTSQNRVSRRHRKRIQEKAKIVQSNNSHKKFSSAIWRLPTEIIVQIFLYCIPEKAALTPAPFMAPMLLTRVCRRWREIAVDMPSLWRNLRLKLGHGNWQQRAFCYDAYLRRSRGRQISLTLAECDDNNWAELRSLLQPYVNQISSLCVWLSSGDSSFPLVISDFGGLEELVVYTDSSNPVQAFAQLPPNMRTLKLLDLWYNFQVLSSFKPLAWASLTHLEVAVEGLDSFPCLLRLCPNLLSLSMIGIFTAAVETSETLKHTKLQTLRLSGDFHLQMSVIEILGLFNDITLPNLRVLEVRNLGKWAHEEFKAFMTRSRCPLESLIFGGVVMTTDRQLAEYATLFPSLKIVTNPMPSTLGF
ncbi:uncharacterized protein EDB93DRAFT_1228660 [Suillus bovinus]|uniref:uncharacterized protein n=1 Tax=Suillus bovinus TaxID=48563 RepID=UPI001B8845D8|nr:uncharacterized protein EDB93DRAFT_1228660 [Suillus bovinus]KAG2143806.1 hypothetical protein EDB93DRAFT_1228660 [Suillus bovinus]